jgi:hypothetical protein
MCNIKNKQKSAFPIPEILVVIFGIVGIVMCSGQQASIVNENNQLIEVKIVHILGRSTIVEDPSGKYWRFPYRLGEIGEVHAVTKWNFWTEVPNKVIKFNENKP